MSIEKIAAIIKKTVKVFVLVGIVAGIVMGMKYWQKSRGWYDSSTGPSESYQEAKLQHNASLASLFDFQLSVNGYYFTVPMRYGEIREMGCKDYPGVDMLDPGETLSNGSWFILGEPNAEEINP